MIPSRAEGARVGDLAEDLKRESEREEKDQEKKDGEKISLKVEEARAAGGALPVASLPRGGVDVLVLLDGPDPDAEARLVGDGVHYLSKKSPGPSKGHALAFLGESLGERLNTYDFILVFDADMRLPVGFFRDLLVPEGTEAFQLPVRPSGVPAPGAPRVEALSLAEARLDDLGRSADGLPVRLRGKAMGFSPRAFRLGPAAAVRTTAEDSEATLALLARGVVVRALDGPCAFDAPPAGAGAMGRSRARWFGGHLKLLFTGLVDLLRCAARRPVGTFVLAADLWLRPRILLLGTLAFLACPLGRCDRGSFFEWRVGGRRAGGRRSRGGERRSGRGCGCDGSTRRAPALPLPSFTRRKISLALRVAFDRRAPASHRLSP